MRERVKSGQSSERLMSDHETASKWETEQVPGMLLSEYKKYKQHAQYGHASDRAIYERYEFFCTQNRMSALDDNSAKRFIEVHAGNLTPSISTLEQQLSEVEKRMTILPLKQNELLVFGNHKDDRQSNLHKCRTAFDVLPDKIYDKAGDVVLTTFEREEENEHD